MVRVLRIGREKLKDKAVASASKRVSPLVRQTGKPRAEIVEHLFHSFKERFGGTVDELTPEELSAAERLVEHKYGSPAWTHEFE
jgi:lipoate---protein ligase